MSRNFTEDQVHEYIYQAGLEKLIKDCPEINNVTINTEEDFQLWQIIKQKAFSKIARMHGSVRHGNFIASKLKLPTDKTTPMELDLLGTHEDGLFILELKVKKPAERNAFSELLAYSNYIAEIFASSGRRDITNVLVARLDAKITRHAFLYDLLIADRNTIVYKPSFTGAEINTLHLDLYLPSDEDFKNFTNELLSHDSMSCVAVSFHDVDGWFDSKEDNGSLNDYTKDHLEKLSNYTAQLMEADGLHGFCFIRKRWAEIPSYYGNTIFVCSINPFKLVNHEKAESVTNQLSEENKSAFFECATLGFDGRLIQIAKKAVTECLIHNHGSEIELPLWAGVVNSMIEVVFTHNFGFNPTGLLRDAYVAHLENIYAHNEEYPGGRMPGCRIKRSVWGRIPPRSAASSSSR